MFKISVHYRSLIDGRPVEFYSKTVEHFLVGATVADESQSLPDHSWIEVHPAPTKEGE